MSGADVLYQRRIDLPSDDEELLQLLIRETPWRQERVLVWGKQHLQPRLIAWYGDQGTRYTYSGLALHPLGWTKTLTEIKSAVERVAEVDFNSVLLNYYRDNRDSMGFHSDDEPELGDRPVIASISLGAERTLIFQDKATRATTRLRLQSGSCLLMRGDTQLNWRHGIQKESRRIGPRVNLTFRRIVGRGR